MRFNPLQSQFFGLLFTELMPPLIFPNKIVYPNINFILALWWLSSSG